MKGGCKRITKSGKPCQFVHDKPNDTTYFSIGKGVDEETTVNQFQRWGAKRELAISKTKACIAREEKMDQLKAGQPQ